MTSIGGMTACGKRGGPSFIDTVRVDAETFDCPAGYEPCSKETTASETICWPLSESKADCPIIDILVISTENEERWNSKGYVTTENIFVANG